MSHNAIRNIPCPASVAAGATVDCTDIKGPYAIQLDGTFVGTVQFQASIDGSGWVSIGGAKTAAAIIDPINDGTAKVVAFNYVRANVTAYTSGAMNAVVTGEPL